MLYLPKTARDMYFVPSYGFEVLRHFLSRGGGGGGRGGGGERRERG